MKDNLSIIITMIVFVILIVIFPLYNYFERQDDMSYNMVLKSTTNFVDEVINCGYIDQDMYNTFIDKISITGNLYDIELEAHKRTYTKDPYNLDSSTFIEQYNIDYNKEIFDEATSKANSNDTVKINNKVLKNGVYHLNVGDQIYVKLKNSGTTMAGAIFNIIVPASKKERITVNYGGIIKNNAWEKMDISNLFRKELFIEIKADQALNPGLPDKILGNPTFSLDENTNPKFNVKIANYDTSTESSIAQILKDNLKLKGFKGENYILPSSVTKKSDTNEWIVTYDLIQLKSKIGDFFGTDFYMVCSAELPANVIQGDYFKNPNIITSNNIVVKQSNSAINTPVVEGVFLTGSASVAKEVELGDTALFRLKYNSGTPRVNAEELKTYLINNNFTYDNLTVTNDTSNKCFNVTYTNVSGTPGEKMSLTVKSKWATYFSSATGRIEDVAQMTSSTATLKFSTKTFSASGKYTFIVPTTGIYKLEVVGANGGGDTSGNSLRGSKGGRGGISYGNITLQKGQSLTIYVGGVGKPATTSSGSTGGYNGGGNGNRYVYDVGKNLAKYGFGGGGATDIRFGGEDLGSRIIVAGGGGGADDRDLPDGVNDSGIRYSFEDGTGGYGGGGFTDPNGGSGYIDGRIVGGADAGTLSSGYKLGIGEGVLSSMDGGGGGGGYYGGFASENSNGGGGGGSGYISAVFKSSGGKGDYNTSIAGNGYAKIYFVQK